MSQNINMRSSSRVDSISQLSEIVSAFMRVSRATTRDGRFETDGEHTLHLQYIAVAYAARYHPELDIGKVCLFALVHDLVEVYAGDVNSLTATYREIEQKHEAEKRAYRRLVRELGAGWSSLIVLIEDYEKLESKEAKFVKCFDKCDASLSHYHDKGRALKAMGINSADQFHEVSRRTDTEIRDFGSDFQDIIEIRQELVRRVSHELHAAV